MPSLSWHPDAIDDVARLYDFLVPVSPSVAKQAASIIKEAADRIAVNPYLGLPRAEFREWFAPFGRSVYVLRYHILPSGDVLITRVWHSRELRP